MKLKTDGSNWNDEFGVFSGIYDGYWKKVLWFTRLYLTDSYEQEEVVQEAFIRLWEMRDEIDQHRSIDGLLFIITRNLIFDRRRRSLNESALKDALKQMAEIEYDMEEEIDADNLREYVEKLVELLPERQRESFILSRYKHLSVKDIASRMSISERGVERNIYLALKFLRKHLPMFILFMECAGRHSDVG